MKQFVLFLFGLFFFSQSYGQDPELFKTWYLTSIYLEGQQVPYYISEVDPEINPTLTITEDLQYAGVAACNTFTGQYSYQNELLYVENFDPTNNTCNFQSHTQFEDYYFSFFMEETDTQIGYLSETYLILNSPIFTSMHFSDQPLGLAEDEKIIDIKLYPNPSSDKLMISSEIDKFKKMKIYSISGEKVLEVIDVENTIDISSLSKGMYFLEIISSEGRDIQKFVKN